MKELSLKEFYAQSMELKAPWKEVEVTIDKEARQVRIVVECACGEVWGHPTLKFPWDWVETARATELRPLAKAADMIEKPAAGILNYLRHPICLRLSPLRSSPNADAAGINSVIQSLKPAARGLPRF